MVSLPVGKNNCNDLSSICNFEDASTPSIVMCEESMVETIPKNICSEAFAYRDEAIPFITITEDSKQFEVHPEAARLLESIEGEIGVVTIAGPYRTGKSSLAGRALLANPKAFQSAPTVNSCTKGLWIYARPMTDCKTIDGEQATAVVIDSEGLNALDESQNHDLRIMTLSVLLRSKLIYNSMNAIDESSLQQLNLVVNLTKQIQLRSSNAAGEFQDPEELAKVFPSFLWLVRDFNLALVNQEGVAITAKEYLEISLQEQNGMSERTETKNRTRRLFKSLFTERDCITFDRPIGDETKLQNLSDIGNDQLKPSFLRQLETLKKRVMGKMQTKTVHGKAITGRVLVNLAKQYVHAFNSGQVPNIESAWTYICQNESQKALEQARSQFKSVLATKMVLPCSLFDLECDYKEAKREALKVYLKGAISDGKLTTKGEETVKRECKEIYEQIKVKNDESCAVACQQFLNQYHEEIMASLTQNCLSEDEQEFAQRPIFNNLNQVEATLHQIEDTFEQSGPAGDESMRHLIYEKFRSQIAFESGQYFMLLSRRDGQASLAMLQAKCTTLGKDLADAKKETLNEVEILQAQVRGKERECFDLKAMQEISNLKVVALESQQKQDLDEFKAEFDAEKLKLQESVNDAKLGKEVAETELQRVQRSMTEVRSTAEKENELQVQEISHLKAQEGEFRKRESELSDELKQVAMVNTDERKERENLLQKDLDMALKEIEEANEKAQDFSEQLENAKTQIEEMRQKFTDYEVNLKAMLNSAEQSLATKTNYTEGNEYKLQTMLDEAKKSLEEVTEAHKEMKEMHKSEINKVISEKDILLAKKDVEIALLNQKESQMKELSTQLEGQIANSKTEIDSMLTQLQSKNEVEGQGIVEKQALVDSLQNRHQDELTSLVEVHDQEKLLLEEELDQLNKKLVEYSLTSKVQTVELQKQLEEFQEQVESLEKDKERLEKQYKAQRDRNENIIESMHSKSSQSVVELTQQHEAQFRELEETISETQEQAKQQLTKLKITYEKEKDQVTQKWQDDKLKLKEEEQEIRQDYESRISEDEQKFDEERQFLQSQLQQLQFESKAQLEQIERELLLLGNDHENLIAIHTEKTQELRNLQESSASHLQLQLRSHTEQLGVLQDRIESQSTFITSKEQALITVTLSLDHTKVDLERKRAQLKALEDSQKVEVDRLEVKISALRQDNQQLKDDNQAKKMECSRDIALKEQSIEFLEKKIVEQQAMTELRLRELEEQLLTGKTDRYQQLADQTINFNEQKSEIELKFENRRKAFKALQADFNLKVPELEKRNAVLTQQVAVIERQAREQCMGLQSRLDQISVELHTAHEQATLELKSSQEKGAQIKMRVQELEKENQGLLNEIEKDKALFEDKVKFLTDQKLRLESEKSESDRRLKEDQDNLQRIRGLEKEKATKNRQECVSHLENYYKQLTQRIQDEAKKTGEENQIRAKTLQEQNQELLTQLEIVKRERDSNIKYNQERQDQQDKIEINLRQELASVKICHEGVQIKNQAKLESIRETTKGKVSKADKERKDMELTQTTLRYNFSIEEAKWNMKSEQLQNDIRQLNEEIERLQKKNETLLRENQKMRTSHRTQHQQSINYSSNRSSANLLNNTTSQLKLSQYNKLQSSVSNTGLLLYSQQPQQQQPLINTSTATKNQDNHNIRKTGDSQDNLNENNTLQQQNNQMPTATNHTRNHTTTTTKVLATFSTKSIKQGESNLKNKTNTLLSQSIRESMARCSPRRADTDTSNKVLLQSQQPVKQKFQNTGAASMMIRKSLLVGAAASSSVGMTLTKAVVMRAVGQDQKQQNPPQPFSSCENTLPLSQIITTPHQVIDKRVQKRNTTDENREPECVFDNQDTMKDDGLNQSSIMTLDDLIGAPRPITIYDEQNL